MARSNRLDVEMHERMAKLETVFLQLERDLAKLAKWFDRLQLYARAGLTLALAVYLHAYGPGYLGSFGGILELLLGIRG